MRRACLVLFLGLLMQSPVAALTGCGDDDGVPPPTVEPGGCDLPAFSWLPRTEVGALLSFEEDVLSPLSAAVVDSVLFDSFEYFKPVPYGARVFKVRYTTQDKGQPVEATGLVGLPYTEEGLTGEFPLVLWLHGSHGFTSQCAPSASLNEYVLVAYLLASQGYVVAAPDFIGLDAEAPPDDPPPVQNAYIHIEQVALGSLDSLQPARDLLAQLPDASLTLRDDVIVWGASQGGHAAMAVDLLAPYYTPKEHVLATVAMVPATDLVALANYAASSLNPASEVVAAILVSQHLWYEGAEPLDTLLTATAPSHAATALPAGMYEGCDAYDIFNDATRIEHVYSAELLDRLAGSAGFADVEPWACYLRENSFATTSIPRVVDTPTLFIVSQNDTLVYAPTQREDFDRLCEQGYRLEYLECADAAHADGAIWSLPEQVSWVEARLSGEPLDPAAVCQRTAAIRCTAQPVE